MHAHHRYETVLGRKVFYREAGAPSAPAVVLLHGYPTSSFMFRELIPRLADRYRVIAPDYLGFGLSDAPPVEEFGYTFDALATHVAALLDRLGVREYALYVQDYGAPVGWRLALDAPGSVKAIVTQNGNGYEAGFVPEFWQPIWNYARTQNGDTEAALRPVLGLDAIRWQYLQGEPDPSLVSPDTWYHDAALVQRPGNDRIQLELFRDYITNLAVYQRLHEYLRQSQVPLLAVWGRNDPAFAPAGATAFLADLPHAEVHLLDGGHFLLESRLDDVTQYVTAFLARSIAPATPVTA